jgi:hypothetical protein
MSIDVARLNGLDVVAHAADLQVIGEILRIDRDPRADSFPADPMAREVDHEAVVLG